MNKTRFRAEPLKGAPERVDREKGIIYGVSCNTEGEALGHGVLLEAEFVEKTTALSNKTPKGLRSRFGHPGMSSEALGTYVGRLENFRNISRAGKLRSIADLHIDPSTKSAEWDRGEYIMAMAENSPDMFAMSIVFKGWQYKRDEDGKKVMYPQVEDFDTDGAYYKSVDAYDAIDSPVYASMDSISACDFVDEPAANPDGLFSEDTFAGIAGKFLEEHPAVNEMLKANPDILEMLSGDERFDSFFDEYPKIKDLIDNKPEAAKSFLGKFNKLPSSEDAETEEEVPLDYNEFKEQHPKFYAKALAEGDVSGVKKERERVESHLLLGNANDALDISCEAIEAGAEIDNKYTAKYIQAGINKNALSARTEDELETVIGEVTKVELNEVDAKNTAAFEALMAERHVNLEGSK